jgi:hypothetical protein
MVLGDRPKAARRTRAQEYSAADSRFDGVDRRSYRRLFPQTAAFAWHAARPQVRPSLIGRAQKGHLPLSDFITRFTPRYSVHLF